MCGIVGFCSCGQADDIEAIIRDCSSKLSHRGPDQASYWIDTPCAIALGHTRLAILDLTPTGCQPMISADEKLVIVFNGEIYNHLELRSALEQTGKASSWRGRSDAETLVECFSAWGVERTLQQSVGMFALALWNRETRVLTLARDRMGEKPLYWGWQGGRFMFCSELKALKPHPSFRAEINRDAIALLLRYNYIPSPFTIYSGMEKLQPGHYLTVSMDESTDDCIPKPYWSLENAVKSGLEHRFAGSGQQAVDLIEEQLKETIRGQMIADVPLGAFLSGGIDSSLVVAIMQSLSSRQVNTYTIGFAEERFNEAGYARKVANYLNTSHTEMCATESDALDLVQKLPEIYCEPFADSSQIPSLLVSRMTRKHLTVALSGDGGDELFGGYNTFLFLPEIWNLVNKFPLKVKTAIASFLAKIPLPYKLRKLASILDASNEKQLFQKVSSHWVSPESIIIGGKEPETMFVQSGLWSVADSFQHRMMAVSALTYMVDDVLVKVDRAAMANSLEVRTPFLDHRLVELAWRLPLEHKIRGNQGKWILRELLSRYLPKALFERPKKGFSVPLENWLRGPLRDWAGSLLSRKRLKREGFFRPDPIRRVWKRHLAGASGMAEKLWGVLMFQAWLEKTKYT